MKEKSETPKKQHKKKQECEKIEELDEEYLYSSNDQSGKNTDLKERANILNKSLFGIKNNLNSQFDISKPQKKKTSRQLFDRKKKEKISAGKLGYFKQLNNIFESFDNNKQETSVTICKRNELRTDASHLIPDLFDSKNNNKQITKPVIENHDYNHPGLKRFSGLFTKVQIPSFDSTNVKNTKKKINNHVSFNFDNNKTIVNLKKEPLDKFDFENQNYEIIRKKLSYSVENIKKLNLNDNSPMIGTSIYHFERYGKNKTFDFEKNRSSKRKANVLTFINKIGDTYKKNNFPEKTRGASA